MPRAVSLSVSAVLGLAAAVVVIAFKPGTAPLMPVTAGSSYAPPLTPANNRRPLSASDRQIMRRWLLRVRACANQKDVRLSAPHLASNEFVIVPARRSTLRSIALVGGECASALGGPPLLTSFVVERDHRIHFYKPRACLLPIRHARS